MAGLLVNLPTCSPTVGLRVLLVSTARFFGVAAAKTTFLYAPSVRGKTKRKWRVCGPSKLLDSGRCYTD